MDENGGSSLKMTAEAGTPKQHSSGRKDSYCLEMFSVEIDNVKEDLVNLEKLYCSLQESNEDIKNAEDSTTMREIRIRLNTDLDDLFKLAKQVNKKYEGLVRANAAQRGSVDDDVRATMIAELVENLQNIMRRFQALRTQVESDHRQIIEARFGSIRIETLN